MKMAQLSTGGFIVLPGGYGTYEEMMEMITWNQVSFDPSLVQLDVLVFLPVSGTTLTKSSVSTDYPS
jgi:predicted Rossmann-fold nucleotide-binding protein